MYELLNAVKALRAEPTTLTSKQTKGDAKPVLFLTNAVTCTLGITELLSPVAVLSYKNPQRKLDALNPS